MMRARMAAHWDMTPQRSVDSSIRSSFAGGCDSFKHDKFRPSGIVRVYKS